MHKLNSYPGILERKHQVQSRIEIENDFVVVEFEVEFSEQLNINNDFKKNTIENWGLWDYDVVEVFLSRHSSRLPYLEVQVSPLGQCFALEVDVPRKQFKYPERFMPKVDSKVTNHKWECKIVIPLERIPGSGESIFGNLHSCLGMKSKREYFGLNISDRIDFHRPEFFVELGKRS